MPSNRKMVYIVDDDESICRALKILLMTFDFDVKTFNSAQSFFDALPNDDLGCLVLDIHMPGIDGWTAQKKVFDSGSKRPIIFMSAEKIDNAAGRALKAGAVGFLQKPFIGQALVDLINAASEDPSGINRS